MEQSLTLAVVVEADCAGHLWLAERESGVVP